MTSGESIIKALKETFSSEEGPPKFREFRDSEILLMVDMWEKQLESVKSNLNKNLWGIEREQEDMIRSIKNLLLS